MYRTLELPSRNDRLPAPSRAQDERTTCAVCGTRIARGQSTIKIDRVLVHIRCAVHRRMKQR